MQNTNNVTFPIFKELAIEATSPEDDATAVTGRVFVAQNPELFTYDANGNVSEYVSINGSIVAHYDYSPFGETLIESGDLAATFTHRFSTKPWCPVTGLYEYQMRKYRPGIGRWLSRDPIGEDGGEGLYCYAFNSPMDSIDFKCLSDAERILKEAKERFLKLQKEAADKVENGEL